MDAHRENGFSDLVSLVNSHYRVHENVEKFLGPYNAKQRNSQYTYQAPDKETLKQLIPRRGMNDFSYQAYVNAIIRFCENTKGTRGLPAPHPSTIHSIQLPQPAFELKNGGNGITMVSIMGIKEPISVGSLKKPTMGLRHIEDIKFIIVRPKLSQLGTASANNWEVLFYKESLGYIPEWADSHLNPRYSGKLN